MIGTSKARYIFFSLIVGSISLLAGCQTNSTRQVMLSTSQVEARSYQIRKYDMDDKPRMMRAVLATLQDLGFVIDKADKLIGVITATKLEGYVLTMSVSVRERGEQLEVRANAQYNLNAVEDPEAYRNFFTSLEKSVFLEKNI